LAGNFWARAGQATASHFGDAFGWQLLSPDGANNSESFRRRFWLATSEPGRGKQQRVISATLLAGNFWARTGQATASHFGDASGWQLLSPDVASNSGSFRRRFWLATSGPGRGKHQGVISATLLAGNFWARAGQATSSHFGDAFGWQLLSRTGQGTTSHFGDAFGWQLLSPDGASNSELFRRRFWLATF